MLSKIKKICILGGGLSGWLSAAYLLNNLRFKPHIILLDSNQHSPIGVGEGTQPFTSAFLYACGLKPKDWMKPSNATFKYGVELINWTNHNYFVDNDHFISHAITENLFAHDYFIEKDPQEYFDWLPSYQLAKANVSPKISEYDINTGPGLATFGAVHFSSNDIIDTIKDLILEKIEYYNIKIDKITKNQSGIECITDDQGQPYQADLFIDCTGFSSTLLEKELGVEFLSYENLLPCNKAVTIQKRYSDPYIECHPYTKATTMSSGWRWTIPTFRRIGNGYVYSDKFIDSDSAEKELRLEIDEWDNDALHLSMKCGRLKTIAEKNTVAVGLSAGFIEPLEATGITFTTKIIEWLTILLNHNSSVWGETIRGQLNKNFNFMSIEIFSFIWSHYYFSTRNDTEFWKQFKNKDISEIPESVNDIMKAFLPAPSSSFYLTPDSMFHQGHWFSVLHSGGLYKNLKQKQDWDEEKYLKYFIDLQHEKVKLAKQTFPNHYEYLLGWYNS